MSDDGDDALSHEILNVAYRWARIRATIKSRQASKSLDLTYITEKVRSIEFALKNFSQVKTQCTNASKAITSIEESIDAIRDDISTKLDAISSELAKS